MRIYSELYDDNNVIIFLQSNSLFVFFYILHFNERKSELNIQE